MLSIFGRKKPVEPALDAEQTQEEWTPPVDDTAPEPVAELDVSESGADSDPVSTGASDEPKEDLKFLWAPEESAPVESAPVESELPPLEPEPVEAIDELQTEVEVQYAPIDERLSRGVPRSLLDDVQEPRKPGLFARLFSRKKAEPEPEFADELPELTDEPAAEPVEAAAEEALDAGVETIAEYNAEPALEEALPADAAPAEPKKRGFFARLMGRSDAPEADAAIEVPADEPPSVEAHEVAEEVFDAARNEFVPEQPSQSGFATVDDALPLDAPPAEAPDLGATAGMDVPTGLEEAPSYHAMPVYDFDTPADAPSVSEERSTVEVDMPAVDAVDARPTAEVTANEVAEATAAAAAVPVEEDRDTDEFVALDATIVEDPDKTNEVAREPGFFQKLFGKTKEVTQVEPAVAPPPSANPNFLVQKFRTFYNEVVVYKNQKAELTAGFATAIVTSYDADLSPEQSANSLAVRLHQMLELQLAESSWMGGESQELYPEAQYAMAVLADEMLTHVEWPGQAAWGTHRLELTVFKTAASDVEFFKRVDRLLKNGPHTPGTRDLARVYLLTIASGFKGKYRPFGLHRPLAEYRRRLYEFVYGGDALLLYADERRIFPEATSVTVAGRGVRRVSMAQQWAAILVLLLAGYTVISHITWNRVSAELKDIAGRVEQARAGTTAVDVPNSGAQ